MTLWNTWYVVYCCNYNSALLRLFYEWLVVYLETISAITDCCCFLPNNYNNEKKHLSLDTFRFWITTVPSLPIALHTENPKPLLPSSFSCQRIIHQKLGNHSSSASWVTYFNTWRKNATWKSKQWWEDNTKIDLKTYQTEKWAIRGLDSFGSECGLVTGIYYYDNELFTSVKGNEFLH